MTCMLGGEANGLMAARSHVIKADISCLLATDGQV